MVKTSGVYLSLGSTHVKAECALQHPTLLVFPSLT